MSVENPVLALLAKIEVMVVYQKVIHGEAGGKLVFIPKGGGAPWSPGGPGDGPYDPKFDILRLATESRDPEMMKVAEITARAVRNDLLNIVSETAHAA